MMGGAILVGAVLFAFALAWFVAHKGSWTRRHPLLDVIERDVICPESGALAHGALVRDLGRGKWTDVQRCSERPGEDPVACRKHCVVQLNTPTVLPRTHREARLTRGRAP